MKAATWNEIMPLFRSYLEGEGFSKITVDAYCMDAGVFRDVVAADIKQLTEAKVQSAFEKIRKDKGDRSASRVVSATRKLLSFLYMKKILSKRMGDRPAGMGETPSQRVTAIKDSIVTEKEVSRIAKFKAEGIDLRDKIIVSLMYACGLTTSEVANLELSDITVKPGRVRIKTKKGTRDVELPAFVQAMIMNYLAHRSENSKETGSSKLFHGASNRAANTLTRQTIFHAVNRIFQKAGITRAINPEMLRMYHFYQKIKTTDLETVLREHGITKTTAQYLLTGTKKAIKQKGK